MSDAYRDDRDALLARKKALEQELRSTEADLRSFQAKDDPARDAQAAAPVPEPPTSEEPDSLPGSAEALLPRLLDLCETSVEAKALREALAASRHPKDEAKLAEGLQNCTG